MSNTVCVVGIGVVESDGPIVDLSHKEMLFYSTRRALDDAGLERKDIGSAITASFDFFGREEPVQSIHPGLHRRRYETV